MRAACKIIWHEGGFCYGEKGFWAGYYSAMVGQAFSGIFCRKTWIFDAVRGFVLSVKSTIIAITACGLSDEAHQL
jgi:hypothetical protein